MITTHNKENDPRFTDPRFQRRIVAAHRPIEIVENMHDLVLECGHSPLVFGVPAPQVGDMCFCPDCAEGTAKAAPVGGK